MRTETIVGAATRHRNIPVTEETPTQAADGPLSWADSKEVDTFDLFVHRFWRGEITPEEFKRFRLQHGIYGQRQDGLHMVRVKIPWGGLTAAQLDRLAELAEATPGKSAHVTTRQNIQFYGVKPEALVATLQRLAEVGLTKEDIRSLSRMLGLPTWDLPASPCLASRIAYGTPVTVAALRAVDAAEEAVRRLGFRELRVRHLGETARVEIAPAELPRLADPALRQAVEAAVSAAGYSRVVIDPQGYRRGRLNEALPLATRG